MKKYILVFAACSMLLCCKQGGSKPEEDPLRMPCSCADEWTFQKPTSLGDLAWDYPLKPGTVEWEQYKFKDQQEMYDVCQIPDVVLSSLLTEDLVEICMQFPMLINFTSSVPLDKGIDLLFEKFNGVREIFQRKDASEGLLKWYRHAIQNLSFLNSDASSDEKGTFSLRIAAAELILSRYQSSEDAENLEIIQHLICGYEKKFAYPESFTFFSQIVNCFARAKVMFQLNVHIIEEVPQGFDNPAPYDYEQAYQTCSIINKLSCQFIK